MTESWMVRRNAGSHFNLFGPIGRDELMKMVREGELSQQDEVCRGGAYWFYLHEAEEVRAALDFSF